MFATYGWPVVIVAFFSGLSVHLLRICLKRWIDHYRLNHHGVEGLGRITALEIKETSNSGPALLYGIVTVEMTLGDQIYEQQHDVDQNTLAQLEIGQAIPVHYLPEHPKITRLTSQRHSEAYQLVVFAAMVITILSLLTWIKLFDLIFNGIPW
ncbi:MAG: DUF3592 domain-containing protein [Anaerolineae bacterium]|jgi:hypothetical protein|nr:DUF3592 domain-containing protein [Anaerolineae bacterium]